MRSVSHAPVGHVEAVTFDFWNTICVAPKLEATRIDRSVRLRGVLGAAGAEVADDALDAALVEVRKTFDERWRANRQFTYHEAVEQLLDRLGLELDEVSLGQFAASFNGEAAPGVPPLAPQIEPVLRSLRANGMRLGIVCDVGLSPSIVLRRHLDRHGILGLFDHFSFSDEVGSYKPAPEIFEHALEGLGSVPSSAVHVGDLARTDVGGARGLGMTAVRYTGIEDDPDAINSDAVAHHVIANHLELLTILGQR